MFDIHAKLGPWPYRQVKGLHAILDDMDRYGIERAVISSLEAVWYLRSQDGNETLARRIKTHGDRFIAFAVIRPNVGLPQEDLAHCIQDLGMKGMVLYPNYHRFTLSDPALHPLMAQAAAHSIPVCVQVGLEDPRRQFYREIIHPLPVKEIGAFARAYPAVNIIALGCRFGEPEQAGDPLPDNFYFDTSNYEKMGEIKFAVKRFGAAKILFGTSVPLFNPLANVMKLQRAEITEEERRNIASDNARRLLAGIVC